jgi:outer membrane lipoprotein-sorting protein
MKIAAAFAIILIIFSMLSLFSNSNTSLTSLAFGDVLSQIQNSNYTFNMKTITPDGHTDPDEVMIFNGMMRVDDKFVSTIANLRTGDFVLLWHDHKVAVTTIPEGVNVPSLTESPLHILAKPIETLWDLQDGTETSLGEKKIDGQTASGFEVQQKTDQYIFKIVVWANSKTGTPIHVEVNYPNPENPKETFTTIMDSFNMNVELNPSNFTLDIPEGYKHAY